MRIRSQSTSGTSSLIAAQNLSVEARIFAGLGNSKLPMSGFMKEFQHSQ